MIVDFHTHIFPPQVKENRQKYVDADPCFAQLYSNPKAKLVTADELIASMDEAGVDVSVILNIGWMKHELCVETNDYIMESIARYPKRLVGFCAVQPRLPELAARELERCVKSGIKGVGELRPDVQLFDPGNREMMAPIVEVMVKHKLILLTHASEPVGHLYPGKGTITPDKLYSFITSVPELSIVCAHWGGGLPFYVLMPEVKKAMTKVYFDTAASPLLYSLEVYHQVIELVGADKILFGSDYPLLGQRRIIEEIRSLELDEEVKAQLLGGNAKRLLGIESG